MSTSTPSAASASRLQQRIHDTSVLITQSKKHLSGLEALRDSLLADLDHALGDLNRQLAEMHLRPSELDGAPRTPEQPRRAQSPQLPPPGGPGPDQSQSPDTRVVCRVGNGRSYHRQGSPCTKGKEVESLTETSARRFLRPCGQPCCKSLAPKNQKNA